MSDIMESLGKVSARLSEEAFLSNKGLSNEVGIHVFCYAPEHEMNAQKDADLSAAKEAFGGFTDQAEDPTQGAGQSIDDVVAKLMAEQEQIIQKKDDADE